MIYFRLPFGENIFTTDGGLKTLVSFHSFSGNQTIECSGNIIKAGKNDIKINGETLAEISDNTFQVSKEEYLKTISDVVDFLNEKRLKKLVISRQIKKDFSSVDLKKSFLNLCEAYPNAFCYVFNENGECWMGAFSELLGKFNKTSGIFETMSLAGTLPVDADWTEKEVEEQKAVTEYISDILSKYSTSVEVSETFDHISGNIKHLRTDFLAQIHEKDFENLISELHPTPAVCGIPKDVCTKAINNFEKHTRSFYSGYSRIDFGDEMLCFVNLRCAKITKNSATVFAGGGITPLSIPENEWKETELKAAAILKNLAIS